MNIRLHIVRQAETSPTRDANKHLHLTETGRKQAADVGISWQQNKIVPEIVLASPAVPVLETAAFATDRSDVRPCEQLYYGKSGTPQREALMKAHGELGNASLIRYLKSDAKPALLAWGEAARMCVLEYAIAPLRARPEPQLDVAVFTHGVLAEMLAMSFFMWTMIPVVDCPDDLFHIPLKEGRAFQMTLRV